MSPSAVVSANCFAIWRPPFHGRKVAAIAIVGTIAASTAYYSIYLYVLIAPGYSKTINRVTGQRTITVFPCYSFERQLPATYSKFLTQVLDPAHRLDKSFRTEYWSEGRYPQ